MKEHKCIIHSATALLSHRALNLYEFTTLGFAERTATEPRLTPRGPKRRLLTAQNTRPRGSGRAESCTKGRATHIAAGAGRSEAPPGHGPPDVPPKGVDADPAAQAPPRSARDGNVLHNLAIHLREAREGRRQPQYTDGGAGLGPSLSSSAALNCRDHRGDICHAGVLSSPAILVTKEDAHA